MSEDRRLSKIEILIQQEKYAEAEKVLKDLLSTNPRNIYYLSLFAEVNLQQDKNDVAKRSIDSAIGISPDIPYLFYVKSRIIIQEDDYDGAEQNIRQAINLDPSSADYFAWLANIKLAQKEFEEALEYANKALEIDAENLLGLNTRSTALIKLDKSEEAFETIEGALREDPNNAYTHSNYGWSLLEKGDHKKALEHFKEALKINPNFEHAQAGMLQGLKATNPVYRLFLKYSFWMSNLTSGNQWAVIIGFYVIVRILRSVAKNSAALEPFITPLILVLVIVAFSTWVINPIGNLFLRFNKYGQLLLDKEEKMSSNFVAASAAILVLGVLLYFILQDDRFLPVAAFGFAMMVPFSVMFAPTKRKKTLLIYAVLMGIIGTLAIGITFLTGEIVNGFSMIFLLGFVAFQWIANFLLMR